MYRTVALYMLQNGIDPQDEATVSAHCGEADVRVRYETENSAPIWAART